MEEVLSVTGLSKRYGRVQALDSVSFSVPAGSVFGILGPNGSGKTTLLGIVLDVLKPAAGRVRWFGQEPQPALRQKIGSLLETPNFYHYLSAVDNLKITQAISGRGSAGDIEKVLHTVKLYERRHSRFSTYSLGMKQRLAIAAALLGDPGVLVFDEPTNGLDPVGIAEIRQLIGDLKQQGRTIIMASHLLDEVEKVCTHAAILKSGKLITSGPVSEILSENDVVEIRAGDMEKLILIMQQYQGVVHVKQDNGLLQIGFPRGEAQPEKINRYAFDNGIILEHLAVKKQKLETRFLELTNN